MLPVDAFHVDPSSDSLNKNLEKESVSSADDIADHINSVFDDLMERYAETKDPELLRQATLLTNRVEELTKKWSQEIEAGQ